MKIIMVLGACALVSACASSSTTYGPDGKAAYTLNCSGLARSWAKCLEKAGDLCGTRGYNVLQSSGETGSIVSGSGNSFGGATTQSRSMLVECKTPT